MFILRHAWLNLWDKHMTTGRINQLTISGFTRFISALTNRRSSRSTEYVSNVPRDRITRAKSIALTAVSNGDRNKHGNSYCFPEYSASVNHQSNFYDTHCAPLNNHKTSEWTPDRVNTVCRSILNLIPGLIPLQNFPTKETAHSRSMI